MFPCIFPTPATETENQVICVAGIGDRKGFGCLTTNKIPALDLAFEKAQCFPFYTYDEDGTNLRENITDWALSEFRRHCGDESISKWDIFYYTYGILHQSDYREKYQEDLKRNFPRIPLANDFWAFSKAGKQLADLHINYESAPKYTGLTLKETPDMPLNWRVEKMNCLKTKHRFAIMTF